MCSLSHRFNQRERKLAISQQNLWNIFSTQSHSSIHFCLYYHPTKPVCMEEVLWTIIKFGVYIRHTPAANLLIPHTLSQQICYSDSLSPTSISHHICIFGFQVICCYLLHDLGKTSRHCHFVLFKASNLVCRHSVALNAGLKETCNDFLKCLPTHKL